LKTQLELKKKAITQNNADLQKLQSDITAITNAQNALQVNNLFDIFIKTADDIPTTMQPSEAEAIKLAITVLKNLGETIAQGFKYSDLADERSKLNTKWENKNKELMQNQSDVNQILIDLDGFASLGDISTLQREIVNILVDMINQVNLIVKKFNVDPIQGAIDLKVFLNNVLE